MSKEQGRAVMNLKEAHRDFTVRIMTIAHLDPSPYDVPSISATPSPGVNNLLVHNSLFEYAARYWMVHFCQSSMFKTEGTLALPSEFKKNFPNSVLLATVEGWEWMTSFVYPDPLQMHTTALQVRRETVGGEAMSVLQSLINIATASQRQNDWAEASNYFYRASNLSRTILGMSSSVTSGCASLCMECARSSTGEHGVNVTSRTAEMLAVLLESSMHQCGPKSDHVIKNQQALADFHMDTVSIISLVISTPARYCSIFLPSHLLFIVGERRDSNHFDDLSG